jgi:outer membrane receptor protein involved in Fe transport
MSASNSLRRAIRGALLSSATAAATVALPVHAQDSTITEVVVTGTRIVRPDYESASPVISIGNDAIRATGATSIDQVLNTLPQFAPSLTNTSNNPGNGQANIDLRGLGTNRNLVLLNGRRLPASDSDGAVDVNLIPPALLQRVEVLTGGASSVYGSDAIAGVTNFILNDRFTGIQVDGGYNETDRSDGIEKTGSIAAGLNFGDGKGNVAAAVSYTERDQILQGAREFAEVTYKVRKSGLTPLGSATIAEGRTSSAAMSQAAINQGFAQYGVAPNTVLRGQNIAFNPDGTMFSMGNGAPGSVVNFRGARDSGFSDSSYTYNFAPPNALLLPTERWNAVGLASYDFDAVTAYTQLLYADSQVDTQLAAVPAGFQVPSNNPFIDTIPGLRAMLQSRTDADGASTATAPVSVGKRFTEVGARLDLFSNEVKQGIVGLKGNFTDTWTWDVSAGSGEVDIVETFGNDVDLARARQLLNAADGGASLCAGGFNPFGGTLSPACADFIRVEAEARTKIKQHLADAVVSGDVFEMPAGTAKASFGLNWREETYDFDPDPIIANGDSAGFSQLPALSGGYTVREASAELYMPLVKDAPWAQSLDTTVGIRLSDYSTIGSALAYKAEGNWTVNNLVGFRGSYQRAVRAPNIEELFTPPEEDFPPLVENPCNASSEVRRGPNAAQIRTLCTALGIDPAAVDNYNDASAQVQTTGGGNPNLEEEQADTFTVGVVFTSPWDGALSDLKASIDYYSISVDNAIETAPAGEILLLCFNYKGGNPTFSSASPYCANVDYTADTDTGGPMVTANDTSNISKLETTGIDVQVDYGVELGAAGKLRLNLLTNFLGKYDFTYPGIPTLEFGGTIGPEPGDVYPDWKGMLNVNWALGPVNVGLRYRYLPSMDNRYADYSADIQGVPSIDYLDATFGYDFKVVRLTVGANNINDQQPPLYSNAPQMNTDPSTYDVLGRTYFARAIAKF